MTRRDVVIGSRIGLHARPAAMFVQAVNRSGTPVTIRREHGMPVDGRSIIGVLAIGARNGDTVILESEGDAAETVLDGLAELLARDLDDPAADD